jgi:S1-C subfamily serine protease
MVMAAVIGGGVTAVTLLAAGAVESGGTSTRASLLGAGELPTPVSATAAGRGAREIYEQEAPGVVFVRARTLRTEATPFDVYETAQSTGSGCVLDDDGLILTSAHVVAAATDIRVTFSGAHTVAAKVVGKDPDTDLALLRVDPEGLGLTPLELGESSAVEVGDPVVAIGNPAGLERTLTIAVVSALRRSLTAPSGFTIEHVIQTDAALDPGNSGGPLLDAAGRVIGINSQIAAAAGGDSAAGIGIGFAVPVDTVKAVIPQLEEAGRVERAYLGIEGSAASGGGVMLERVVPGSPAAAAGVRAGDLLRGVDGDRVQAMADVASVLERHHPGDAVRVDVRSNGQPRTLEATLADRPPAQPAR